MSRDLTINQNVAKCLRDVSNLGSTTVYNACTGTHTVVQWGFFDWIGALVITWIVAIVAIVAIICIAAWMEGGRQ